MTQLRARTHGLSNERRTARPERDSGPAIAGSSHLGSTLTHPKCCRVPGLPSQPFFMFFSRARSTGRGAGRPGLLGPGGASAARRSSAGRQDPGQARSDCRRGW
eukprot:211673-Hanusia_phi.AAC.1